MNKTTVLASGFAIFVGFLAEATSDTARGNGGSILFSADNDVLASSDDHYTNGVQFAWVSDYLDRYTDAPGPEFLLRKAQELPFVNDADRQRFISYSLSHRIFTPSDISDPNLIENDMPYSGLAFATITAGAQDARKMDAFSLVAGFVGPAALGEEIQNGFHDLIDSKEAKGWDNQLDNELLLNLGWEHRRRLYRFESSMWAGDLISQSGVTVGNLMSTVTFGVGGRFGWNLPDDYAIPPMFFGEETIGSRAFSHNSERRAYLFALVNTSAFANAIFWDGNTFSDSHSIDYDRVIGRFYGGLRVETGKLGFTIGVAATTIPWINPDNRDNQSYGRFSISYTY